MLKYDRTDISEGINVDETMIELIFQKELTLMKQMNQENVSFVIIGIYDIVERSTDFKNITVVHIKKSAYRIYFQHMSKHKAKKEKKRISLI